MESCEDFNSHYADIELTELEIAMALYQARMNKSGVLEAQKKSEMREQMEKEIIRPWNHEELFQFIKYRAVNEYGFSADKGIDKKPVFRVDEYNKNIVAALCYYFTNNEEFEKMVEGWSLKKGICLAGGVGGGKTQLMQLFTRNKRQCYNLISCRTVSSDFAAGGDELMDKYYSMEHKFFMDPKVFFQKSIGRCFDDLGTEESRSYYGNKLNVMSELILNRYDRKREYPWDCTHITTNLNMEEIEQFYGTRVRDRFREMFNLLVLPGPSRR